MRPLATIGLVTAIVAGWSACRTPDPLGARVRSNQQFAADGGNANALGVSDILEVRVYQEAELSGIYRVSPEGVIDFPLCGKVPVLGLTSSTAADAITECLRKGFLRRPNVTVMVKEFNSKKVFVFGEVAKPGSFSYEEGMTIIHAVSQAGGFNRTAAKNSVNITRVFEGKELKIPVKVEDIVVGREKNVVLVPGDIIFVPESFL